MVLLILAIVLVCSCGDAKTSTVESEIYLVRHFQKQTVGADGDKNVSLTEIGVSNARLLAEHLQNKRLKSIYSTNYKRTKETAAPTSLLTGVEISIYDPAALAEFAEKILALNHNQLVVGHSNTTGALFGLLGCENIALTEQDYGDIMLVKRIHSNAKMTISACETYKLVKK
jgi:broad specificity phosphatase PhoE